MSAPDARVWLQHRDHLGYFHCPAAAVQEYVDLGWQRSEAAPESNPVIAELVLPQPQPPAEQPTSTRKSRAASSPEGSE